MAHDPPRSHPGAPSNNALFVSPFLGEKKESASSSWRAYLFAVAITALCAAIRWGLDPLLSGKIPVLLFTLSVAAGAALGGLGPGLLATGLGAAAADYLFFEPRFSFAMVDFSTLLSLMLFVAAGIAVSALGEYMRRTARGATADADAIQFHSTLLLRIREGISLADEQGVYCFTNRAFNEMHGYDHDELTGKHYSKVVAGSADERTGDLDQVVLVLREKGAWSGEIQSIRKDGSLFFAHCRVSRLDAADGRCYWLGLTEDVTDRKLAVDEARWQQRRLQLLQAQLPAILWTVDRDLRVTSTEGKYYDALGVDPRAAIGRTLQEIIGVDDPRFPSIAAHLGALRGESVKYESTYKHRVIDCRVEPLRDADGKIEGAIGLGLDITEQKRLEQEIRVRQRRQAAVAQLGQWALRGLDLAPLLSETIHVVSQALEVDCCEILELGPDSRVFVPVAVKGARAARPLDAAADTLARYTLQHGGPVIVAQMKSEKRFARLEFSGQMEIVSALSVVVFGRERPFGVLAVGSRSRRKFSADDAHFLQTAANVLSAAVERKKNEDRVQELLNELGHVQRLASMGEMATGLAHELNQPLTAIANYAEAGKRQLAKGEASQAAESLGEISGQALRAGDVIRRLRAFVARRATQREEIRFAVLVREVLKLLDQEIRQRQITVRLALGEELSPVVADSVQIQQVLLNLIRNGLEAMEETARERRVLAISAEQTSAAVEIRISDSGRGLDPAVAENLFVPFQTTKPHGLGMGLAISRALVESHGGRIGASRNADGGTTFYFRLPIPPARREAA